jgi:hypothetical protein
MLLVGRAAPELERRQQQDLVGHVGDRVRRLGEEGAEPVRMPASDSLPAADCPKPGPTST